MKPTRKLSAIVVSVALLISCNGNKQQTNSTATDSTTTRTDTTTKTTVVKNEAPAKPSDVMIVRHKVANYAKWQTAFDAHDSMRVASGLHAYVIGRGVEDSNTIMAVVRMDDTARAKEFGKSASLRDAMKKSGVVGPPTVMMLDMEMLDTTNTNPTRVIVTHKVKDRQQWRKTFDAHKQSRIDAGMSDRAIGYSIDDDHMVTVVFNISDMAKAKAFMNSKDLKDKMAEAGVMGKPDIFMYNVVKKY
jgi:hypothetical protein